MLEKQSQDVQKVGTALIGGDFTGDARGSNAVDIQVDRSVSTQVSSGNSSVALGRRVTASAYQSVALGVNVTASGSYSVSIGVSCTAGYNSVTVGRSCLNTSGDSGVSIGHSCNVSATDSVALGRGAKGRVSLTTNIRGPIINSRDDDEDLNDFLEFCGVEVTLMSKEVNLETVADQTLTLPSNCKFWLDEVGIIATSIVSLSTQPTIRFGITGSLAKHLAAVITTDLTATAKRETFTPLVPADGETTLTAGVTIVAVGTTVLGRFYWKGVFIEDE